VLARVNADEEDTSKYTQVLLNLGMMIDDKSRSGAMIVCINKNIFYMSEKHSQEILILTLISTPKKYIIRRNMGEDTSFNWNINLLSNSGITHLDIG
jgi:hypothetical protein